MTSFPSILLKAVKVKSAKVFWPAHAVVDIKNESKTYLARNSIHKQNFHVWLWYGHLNLFSPLRHISKARKVFSGIKFNEIPSLRLLCILVSLAYESNNTSFNHFACQFIPCFVSLSFGEIFSPLHRLGINRKFLSIISQSQYFLYFITRGCNLISVISWWTEK